MKKNILIVIGLLFALVNYAHGQNLAHLLMNQEISRVESYRNGLLSLRSNYVTEGRRTIVYQTEIQSMQTHMNREYIFGENIIETNNFFPDGFQYGYAKSTFLDGLLIIFEYEDFFTGNSGKIEYFYDSNGNLLREVGIGFERNFTYSNGNLVLVETVNRRNERRSERVEQIDGNTVHTPSYDLYIRTDKKVIENKKDGDTRTITITYYLDDKIFEKQRYIYINDRIERVMIDNRFKVNVVMIDEHWSSDVLEIKFFY
jgi:hypothetical protein